MRRRRRRTRVSVSSRRRREDRSLPDFRVTAQLEGVLQTLGGVFQRQLRRFFGGRRTFRRRRRFDRELAVKSRSDGRQDGFRRLVAGPVARLGVEVMDGVRKRRLVGHDATLRKVKPKAGVRLHD